MSAVDDVALIPSATASFAIRRSTPKRRIARPNASPTAETDVWPDPELRAADARQFDGIGRCPDGRVAAVFDEHWLAVRRRAFQLVRDDEIADDLAQEAFARLWAAHRRDRWPDVPIAWLTVVVSNLASSHFRRARVARDRAGEVSREYLERVPSFADVEFRADFRGPVLTAIGRLSPDRRRAVLLAGAGYSAVEIGRVIDRTPAGARTLVCRARHELRVVLADVITG